MKPGWTATPENVLYRLGFHVADSDEQAAADFEASHARRQRGSPVLANQALEATIAGTGYYGADHARQGDRVRGKHELADRLELGQIMLGSSATVLAQARRIRRQLGAGIFDVLPAFELGDRTLHSLESVAQGFAPTAREVRMTGGPYGPAVLWLLPGDASGISPLRRAPCARSPRRYACGIVDKCARRGGSVAAARRVRADRPIERRRRGTCTRPNHG